jgi:hypothetical protein
MTGYPWVLAEAVDAGMGLIPLLFALAIVVLVVAMFWKLFEKAGQPGWAILVPFYNLIVLAQVAGKPGWWGLLLWIPVVGFVLWILMAIGIAERFGQSGVFAIGILLFWFIFIPILAFGDYQWQPAA